MVGSLTVTTIRSTVTAHVPVADKNMSYSATPFLFEVGMTCISCLVVSHPLRKDVIRTGIPPTSFGTVSCLTATFSVTGPLVTPVNVDPLSSTPLVAVVASVIAFPSAPGSLALRFILASSSGGS